MAFAVFDVETRVDKHLLNRVYYDGQALSDSEAFERYREDLRRRRDSDFFPITLHLPISIAIGNVGDDYVLNSVESLALGDYSEEKLVREFWARAERFAGTLVSFNGRRFDIPVLELAALRHAIAAPIHFAEEGGARHRYLGVRHFDLFDYLTNFGAVALAGGMDLLLKMIGMPGKSGIDGSMVQEYFESEAKYYDEFNQKTAKRRLFIGKINELIADDVGTGLERGHFHRFTGPMGTTLRQGYI